MPTSFSGCSYLVLQPKYDVFGQPEYTPILLSIKPNKAVAHRYICYIMAIYLHHIKVSLPSIFCDFWLNHHFCYLNHHSIIKNCHSIPLIHQKWSLNPIKHHHKITNVCPFFLANTPPGPHCDPPCHRGLLTAGLALWSREDDANQIGARRDGAGGVFHAANATDLADPAPTSGSFSWDFL